MMQAIVTRYHGPTNTKGTRYSATSSSGHKVYIHKKYELDEDDNHELAARALMKKLGWAGKIAGGSLKDAHVWVFVTGTERDASRRTSRPARRTSRPASRTTRRR